MRNSPSSKTDEGDEHDREQRRRAAHERTREVRDRVGVDARRQLLRPLLDPCSGIGALEARADDREAVHLLDGLGKLAAEPLRLSHCGRAHDDEQQAERDEETEPDEHDRDPSPALEAAPHDPDDRIEREREHDPGGDAQERVVAAGHQPDDDQHGEQRRSDREERHPVELERHSASCLDDHVRQGRGDRCAVGQMTVGSVGGVAGLVSHHRYCRSRWPTLRGTVARQADAPRRPPSRSLRVAIAFSSVVLLLIVIVTTFAVHDILSDARHTLSLFVAAGVGAILLDAARRPARTVDAEARRHRDLGGPSGRRHGAGRLGSVGRRQPADRPPARGRAERRGRDRAVGPLRQHRPRVPARRARDRGRGEPQPGFVPTGSEGRAPSGDLSHRRHPDAVPALLGSAHGHRRSRADLQRRHSHPCRVGRRSGTAPGTRVSPFRAGPVLRRRVRDVGSVPARRCAGAGTTRADRRSHEPRALSRHRARSDPGIVARGGIPAGRDGPRALRGARGTPGRAGHPAATVARDR